MEKSHDEELIYTNTGDKIIGRMLLLFDRINNIIAQPRDPLLLDAYQDELSFLANLLFGDGDYKSIFQVMKHIDNETEFLNATKINPTSKA